MMPVVGAAVGIAEAAVSRPRHPLRRQPPRLRLTPARTVTYAAAGPVNGVDPVCVGDWRIDPYYPTLLDMTVNVHVSSLNVPDGTLLYVGVVGSQAVYPFTSNVVPIVAGAGSCSEQIFIYPGTTLTGVIISDASGNILFAGN